MKGKCLCGQIEYEITGNLSNLYQCSCTICQKASGTSKSSSLITDANGVKWIRGSELIASYTKDNGFRTDFCSVCGSPVPNKMNIGNYMCVPAGSVDGLIEREVVAQIHTKSTASWDKIANKCEIFLDGPDNIEDFINLLQRD